MGVEKSPSAFNLRCSARETTEVVKQAGNRFCFLLSHPGKENGKLPLSLCGNTSYSERTAEPGVCDQLAGSLGHPAWWPLRPECLRAPALCLLLAGHTVLELNALLRLGVQLALGSCAS